MKASSIILICVALISCGGMSDADKASTIDAAKLAGMAYQHSDGGAERALVRGAYCSSAAVLGRNGLAVPEAGIQCQ